MKTLTILAKQLLVWIDMGVDAKTKVTIGFMLLVIFAVGLFAMSTLAQQRDLYHEQMENYKETVSYLREENRILQHEKDECNKGRNDDLRIVAERSQRQKEISDSIHNMIKSLK